MSLKAKGQTMVFEQVLIFGIGVAIFAASFALFAMYQSHYSSSSSQDQLTGVKEYVLSSIVRMCNEDNTNSSAVLGIPKTIGDRFYKISLSPDGLNLSIENVAADFSPLYGLEKRFEFSGMALSDLGKIIIYKRGTSVFIDRKA